ncbi:phospholipase A2 inhibitor and Ly6/PLAUR domain-containing protein-like isoform X1 [Xiphophorus couchianus]|uniref:phospholipase A2 inhibitor and Ly6/PLAUR domain-containing protein-like isoform X1 n=1 Tax=Xiphophorus couchianus TaxID=32473 RepID=UPI0010168AE5|nr:phospholipase A2 inhibitor and Ly6/PLAUR domain-containing protein-like isoform X1 [Xiphophorus couchianus]XP_027871393.1 phospholipase A2 inhibitor and Ly6/PLAUR domain-containing protein-like isoform X1 [Xiphophorus couchianus]
MFLFTLVLVVLFLPEADNLKCKCESDSDGTCAKETTECPSEDDRCSVRTQVYYLGGAKSEHNSKGCITSELCISFSVSYGAYRIVQNTKCCSEDLCNAQINYTKPVSTPNRKKCYNCDEENCMKTVKCAGDENYCINVTGYTQGERFIMKGCASKLVCSGHFSSVMSQFTSRPPGAKISCCRGNYCNGASSTISPGSKSSASSTSPTLLLLLVPLLFSNFFS